MKVAKIDSPIEERLQKVEEFLASVGLRISAPSLCIEDIAGKRNYRIDDVDNGQWGHLHNGSLPRAFDSERLVLIEDN